MSNCNVCQVEKAQFRCSRCKAVSYCSERCQKAGWKQGHKTQCPDFLKNPLDLRTFGRRNPADVIPIGAIAWNSLDRHGNLFICCGQTSAWIPVVDWNRRVRCASKIKPDLVSLIRDPTLCTYVVVAGLCIFDGTYADYSGPHVMGVEAFSITFLDKICTLGEAMKDVHINRRLGTIFHKDSTLVYIQVDSDYQKAETREDVEIVSVGESCFKAVSSGKDSFIKVHPTQPKWFQVLYEKHRQVYI